MPLIDSGAEVTPNMRRWFGLSLGVVLYLIALALRQSSWAFWTLATAGIIMVATYYLFPLTQLSIIRVWRKTTFPIAWIMGHMLLLAVFFGVVFPIGLVLRFFAYDPLKLRQRESQSDWIARSGRRPKSDYFKQY